MFAYRPLPSKASDRGGATTPAHVSYDGAQQADQFFFFPAEALAALVLAVPLHFFILPFISLSCFLPFLPS